MKLFSKCKEKARNKARNSSHRVEYLLSDKMSFNVMEAFRNFKSSLTVSIPKKQSGEGTVIVMTSTCPEDGKTTVAVNLAMMFIMGCASIPNYLFILLCAWSTTLMPGFIFLIENLVTKIINKINSYIC